MPRSKNMNLFLLDGIAQGRIKCTLANWTGVAYKIPRALLKESKKIDLLQQTGVYLLFGESEDTGDPLVYVGQAGIRKNGKGIHCRLEEHMLQSKKDWWNVAVAFTTSNNSFGPTEISYLENRFYHMALDAKRFEAQNDNDPNPGNLIEEKESELEEYIEYAKLVIGALGFPVFEPLRQMKETAEEQESVDATPILRCTGAEVEAKGQQTNEGFVVLQGSRIRPSFTPSCPSSVKKYREKHKHLIGADHELTEDILFSSPSLAASFVCGASKNGKTEWKTDSGQTLREIEGTE